MRTFLAACGPALLLVAIWVGLPAPASAADPAATLTISAPSPGTIVAGSKVKLALAVTGGSGPYSWRLAEGSLPPGLKLHPHNGRISGVATDPGEFRFTVMVTDSSGPQLEAKSELTITVIAGLSVEWKEYPEVKGDAISGSLAVSNQTGQELDLTVIVVAVNNIGRATALGYQHLTIAAEESEQVIPFGASPGFGSYFVRVDAVGHRPGKERVYRAAKQTTDSIEVTQF